MIDPRLQKIDRTIELVERDAPSVLVLKADDDAAGKCSRGRRGERLSVLDGSRAPASCPPMLFGSDNWAGAAPEVLAALAAANHGMAPAYGDDALSAAVERRFCEVFEKDVAVFFVATGGAANGLALCVLAPSYAMVLCHAESHIQMDECAGPEFFTGGAKLWPVAGADGKVTPEAVEVALAGFPERAPHGAPVRILSLTEATECGTVYAPAELQALCDLAHRRGMRVHVDGARFANALAALNCSPAELSWKAGVDALSFGGTKNGCLAAEAVIFFDKALASDFAFRRKRAGHLLSKQRFIAAQFDAYLSGRLWLKLAARANARARALSKGIAAITGCTIWRPTEANAVFASFPDGVAEKLRAEGAVFFSWVTPGDVASGKMQRLVCSWATTEDDVERFLALLRRVSA